jgi:hypothetical protein
MMQAGGAPVPVPGFAPAPVELADGIFALDRRLRMPGGPGLPARTTIVRLGDGGLVVISPPPVSLGGLEALDALGPVAHVVAPNSFHYLYAVEFLERYPGAELHVSPGLAQRVPGLPDTARELDAAPPAWRGAIELAVLRASPTVSETLLFHVPSGTLVISDAAFHMTRFERAWERLFWRAMGVPAGFGPSRSARWLLLRDEEAVRPVLRRAAEWPIRRIVVAHGDAVETDAAAAFQAAFARWL